MEWKTFFYYLKIKLVSSSHQDPSRHVCAHFNVMLTAIISEAKMLKRLSNSNFQLSCNLQLDFSCSTWEPESGDRICMQLDSDIPFPKSASGNDQTQQMLLFPSAPRFSSQHLPGSETLLQHWLHNQRKRSWFPLPFLNKHTSMQVKSILLPFY